MVEEHFFLCTQSLVPEWNDEKENIRNMYVYLVYFILRWFIILYSIKY